MELGWDRAECLQKYKSRVLGILEFHILNYDLVNSSFDGIQMKVSLSIETTFTSRKSLWTISLHFALEVRGHGI